MFNIINTTLQVTTVMTEAKFTLSNGTDRTATIPTPLPVSKAGLVQALVNFEATLEAEIRMGEDAQSLIDSLNAKEDTDEELLLLVVPSEPAAGPHKWSKLKVIDALNDIGVLPILLGYLDSDPIRRLRWDSAQCVMSDDPMVPAAIPAIAALSGKTEDDIQELLNSCLDI